VIEAIEDMPAGTIGIRATGHVTGDEYRQSVLPRLREAAEAGDVRLVFEVGPGFQKFDAGALAQDAKLGLTVGLGHLRSWKRTAVVTDVDWIVKSIHMFAWLTPGEVRVFDLDALEEAKAWAAA
jgi:hypothetical protein